jgi:ribosome-associated protein
MTATDRSIQLAQAAGIDVSEQLAITDIFVIISAESERQVGAIVDEVEDALRELGAKPVRREGQREGRWVLIDFADVVVHVQHDEERAFYDLARLWRDCPEIDLGVVGTDQGGR